MNPALDSPKPANMVAADTVAPSVGLPADAIAQVLRCPVTHGPLRPMTDEELTQLNSCIAEGAVALADDTPVRGLLNAGLVDAGGRYAYRVEDGIVELLADRAIVMAARPGLAERRLHDQSRGLQDFYDTCGWQATDEGFVDAVEWEDLRPVSANYRRKCHERVKRYLPATGRYLLDVGCGPIQYPEYLAYSDGFDFRICVDLSVQALRAAQCKLGDRGIYILGDVTNLPINDHSVDALTCLHMIYHVPADKQAAGVHELIRTLKPAARGVVVYSWGANAPLMRWCGMHLQLPRSVRRHVLWRWTQLRRLLTGRLREPLPTRPQVTPIYFFTHPRRWWHQQDWNARLTIHPWRSLSVEFLRRYINPWLLGRPLTWLAWQAEERCPALMGRIGQYPLMLFEKPGE